MVVFKGNEIVSMASLDVSDHSIALLSEALVHYDIMGVAKNLTHDSASLLGSY